jgi:hypothetical protein
MQPSWLVLVIYMLCSVMAYFNFLKIIAFFASIVISALASLLATAAFLLLAQLFSG